MMMPALSEQIHETFTALFLVSFKKMAKYTWIVLSRSSISTSKTRRMCGNSLSGELLQCLNIRRLLIARERQHNRNFSRVGLVETQFPSVLCRGN